jgi:4-oxalocrotonate tautomerase
MFSRDLNEEEKAALAADITEVIIRHLQSKESSVSVALNEIEPRRGRACGMRKLHHR